ncbi:MAG: M56 family metallopeptidase [Oscillospiraceae bacterium]|nr:M56 family metallopeptidase [Oscillospiraceae bacterium]
MNMILLKLILSGVFCSLGASVIHIIKLKHKRHSETAAGIYYAAIAVLLLSAFPLSAGLSVKPVFTISSSSVGSQPEQPGQSIKDTEKYSDIYYSGSYAVPSTGESESISSPVTSSKKLFSIPENAVMSIVIIWLAGASAAIVKRVYSYMKIKKSLLKNSHPLAVKSSKISNADEIISMFAKVKEACGVKKASIRILNSDFSFSPCTFGIINPVVYITQSVASINSGLEYVFIHECMHIKYRDPALRLGASLASCIHWFNPMSAMLLRDLEELCEFQNDSRVLSVSGKEGFTRYANTLFEIALLISANPVPTSDSTAACILSCCSNEKNNLLRRLTLMKYNRFSKRRSAVSAAICFLLVFAVMAGNTVLMNSCGTGKNPGTTETNQIQTATTSSQTNTPVINTGIQAPVFIGISAISFPLDKKDCAIKNYLGLIIGADYEPAIYESIKTAEKIDDLYYLVNGEKVSCFPIKIEKNLLDSITEKIKLKSEFDSNRLRAFYILRDSHDPLLTDEQREAIIKGCPESEYCPFYILPVNISDHELKLINSTFAEYEIF